MDLVQGFRDANRIRKIVTVFTKYGFGHFFDEIKLHSYLPYMGRQRFMHKVMTMKQSDAVRLTKAFEELGPTFIKLGQLLSLRPDLIDEEYCREFKKLRDDVPGFSFEYVKEVIRKDLKQEMGAIFSRFEEKPIASASIGQVHEAVLKNGEKVAVKVQRPNIRETIMDDIDIMYHLAQLFAKHSAALKNINLKAIIGEFERYTKEELDYNIEGRHISRFYRNFQDDMSVRVPKVYWDYSSKRVLTMSFIEGVKIGELKGQFDRKKVAKTIINSYFKQVFDFGFFHADPHPSNILVLRSDRIAFLDFGIMGKLDQEMRENLIDLFVALNRKDMEGIVNGFSNIGILSKTTDNHEFKEDLIDYLGEYYDRRLEEINPGRLLVDIINLGIKYGAKIPVDLVLLSKGFITAEGLGRELYPQFNLIEESKPFVQQVIRQRTTPIKLFRESLLALFKLRKDFRNLPRQAADILERLKEGQLKLQLEHKDVIALEKEVGRSSNKLILGIIVAALVIGSGLVLNSGRNDLIAYFGFLVAAILLVFLAYYLMREKRVIV